MGTSDDQAIRDFAWKLISLRPRSIKELSSKIHAYCLKHNYDPILGARVIEDLCLKKYIDDENFALWWCDQRRQFRPKGKQVLEKELRLKGVGIDIIKKVLSLASNNDEYTEALGVVKKNIYKWKILNGLKLKKKISMFLGSRGFGWETIHKVIDEMVKKE